MTLLSPMAWGQGAGVPKLLGVSDGSKQQPASEPGAGKHLLDVATIEEARAELAEWMESRGAEAESSDQREAERELWIRLDRVYADQLRSARRQEDFQAEKAEIESQLTNRATPDRALRERPTFAYLELLLDDRDQAVDARRWLDRDREIAREEVKEGRKIFEELETQRRALREKNEKDPGTHLDDLRLAQLRSRLAEETWRLRQHELDIIELQDSIFEPRMQLLNPEIAWVREHLVPADAQRAERERQRLILTEKLSDQLEEAREELAEIAAELVRREQRERIDGAELEVWRNSRQLANAIASVVSRQLLRVDEWARIEEKRLAALLDEVDRETAEAWADDNATRLGHVDNQRRQQISALIRVRRESEGIERRLADEQGLSRDMIAILKRQHKLTLRWLELCGAEVSELNQLKAVRERLAEELGKKLPLVLPSIAEAWGGSGDMVRDVWEYELFTVDDQPVRVRTLIWVTLLVLLGIALARRFSSAAGSVAERHLKWKRGRAAAWRTLLFYGFMVAIVLTIFNLFHFSLTQFSVVSGALAVGLGFGSQNLINNFISGIILLVERPIEEGALIELDGDELWVESIGIRSTVVRSFDNTHIVVPNSRLLEQPVTNWTLSDDVVRQKIAVGVAYGSDTRQVDAVLNKVLKDLEVVRSDPEPKVLFDGFGSSSLDFLAIFHTRLENRFEALTEVRHSIVDAFTKAEIVMSFPQRDVHLSTSEPLEVQMKSAPSAPQPSPANPSDQVPSNRDA